jgi:AcrR family transcriptional regulator
MPKIVDGNERRREILLAATGLIAREGLAAATMRRIADAAGCTTGLVTHYFENKDEILLAALRDAHGAAGRRMGVHAEGGGGLAALELVLHDALPLDDERVREWKVWLSFWGEAVGTRALAREQKKRYEEWRRLVRTHLKSARSAGELGASVDLESSVEEIVALIDGLGLQAVFEPDRLPPSRLKTLVKRQLDRLRAAPPKRRARPAAK